MEHIYTIKVKRQFDPRGLYPSERRYSASTVLGLACLHLALSATALLLAGLALRKAGEESPRVTLALAPALLSAGALAAGLAALLASRRWYVDRNITWFFLSSIVSAVLSLAALCMMVSWIVSSSENLSFCDYFSDGNLFGKVRIVPEDSRSVNGSEIYVIEIPVDELKAKNIPLLGQPKKGNARKVLSINILIAAAAEALWSLLSLKVAWRGMRAGYPEDDTPESRRGPTVRVVTQIKGNNTEHLPKNTRILPPQPDLIEHYPRNNKIKKFFRSQQENGGFFLRTNPNENGLLVVGAENAKEEFPRRESSAEYKERMMNFLRPDESRLSVASWGDVREYPVYDQNTLDLDKIRLTFERRKSKVDESQECEDDVFSAEGPEAIVQTPSSDTAQTSKY